MNFAAIKLADCANGLGVRTVLFVSGCRHHCKGCFQPETWNFDYGKPYTEETEQYLLSSMDNAWTDGLTLLGGEPMEPENQAVVVNLIKKTKAMGKNVWLYSGYTFEELTDEGNKRCHGEHTMEILKNIDVLVDGEFHEEEKDITLKFRGSANQRVINMPETLRSGHITNLF